MNIPIYRAKEINSNEYIKGTGTTDFLNINNISGFEHYNDGTRLWLWSNYFWIEIDPTTLAIHFPDMLDTQGNKIFASLSEDGKGGDIMKDDEYYGIAKYKDSRFVVEYEMWKNVYEGNFEAIGVQE